MRGFFIYRKVQLKQLAKLKMSQMAPTHANSVVTKQQLEANISTSESVDAAHRVNLSTTLTSAYTAAINTQAATTLTARNL